MPTLKTVECETCGELREMPLAGTNCAPCAEKTGQAKLFAALASSKAARQGGKKKKRLTKKIRAGKKEIVSENTRRRVQLRKKTREQRRARTEEEQIAINKSHGHGSAEVITKVNAQRKIDAEAAVKRELARRELARRKLLPYIIRCFEEYDAGWVHRDICERLERFAEAVERGESPRLMLFMPPRHGKSMLSSEFFPAWFLGRNPGMSIIACSYAGSLANDFSRMVQEKLRDPDYQNVFPGVTISRSKESVEEWKIAQDGKTTRGGYLAAGVGGPITGKGAHVAIIDDPVKNAEEADSDTTRASHKRWYSSTFRTRLAPGAGVLVIMTRWHEDDLAGWLLSQMGEAEKEFNDTGVWPDDAERWEVIRYPAIAIEDEQFRNKGEALHPSRYPLRELLRLRRTMMKRDWTALYQQTPTADEGMYFTRNMFRYYPGSPPENLTVYATADFAISKRDSAAYTVIYVVGMDEGENLYLLDERRGRWDGLEIAEQLIDVHLTHKPRFIGGEKGHILMAIKPFLDKLLQERRIYGMNLEELNPGRDDKEMRARPIQGRMKQGKVLWPEGALWVDEAIVELLGFPHGVYKDRADALAWIGQILPLMIPPKSTSHEAGVKKRSWKDRLRDFASKSGEIRNPAMLA